MTPDPLAAFRLDGKVAIVTGASSGLGWPTSSTTTRSRSKPTFNKPTSASAS